MKMLIFTTYILGILMIIHVSGPSGVGKTTLGGALKEQFKNKITVKDTDDLREEFIKERYDKRPKLFDKKAYQEYIDDWITKNSTKPIVLVGLTKS
jgi:adenylate kinase family enzyme